MLDCRTCEDQFCASCGKALSHKNSPMGLDVCRACLDMTPAGAQQRGVCQGCGATATHSDDVGGLCDRCFDVVFKGPGRVTALARHRLHCGICQPDREKV